MTSVSFGGGRLAAQYGVQGDLQSGGVPGRRGHHPDPVEVVADTLKLSADDIRAQLRQGKSLDDVAAEQKVSHDDLVAAIKSGMPDRLRESDRADQVAERIAARKGPAGPPPGGPGGPGGPEGAGRRGRPDGDGDGDDGGPATGVLGRTMTESQRQTVQSLASLLDMKQDDLVSQLRSGTSLADLVASKGVSGSSLASVLQNGLLVDTRA